MQIHENKFLYPLGFRILRSLEKYFPLPQTEADGP
jgi:hypothetical protein